MLVTEYSRSERSRVRKGRRIFAVGAFACTISVMAPLPSRLAGAEQPSTEGTIEFEEDSPERSPYESGQEASISLFQGLLSETIAGKLTPHKVPPAVIKHLAGAYLYCASKQGSCAVILEGLLEVDIANAQIAGEPSCSVLEQFWRSYAAWEFHKREGYLRGVAQAGIAETFAREKLPRFQKCKQAVADALKQDKSARLAAAKKNIANAAFLLTQFKQKVPNIFTALGITEQTSRSGDDKKGS